MKAKKKPITVEVFQMTRERRDNNSDWPQWLHRAWNKNLTERGALFPRRLLGFDNTDDRLVINTLEDIHVVDWDDYIIQGVQGELYPCKPDIFKATYDIVEE